MERTCLIESFVQKCLKYLFRDASFFRELVCTLAYLAVEVQHGDEGVLKKCLMKVFS